MLTKSSSSIKESEGNIVAVRNDKFNISKIPRKMTAAGDVHVFESSYSSRTESTIHFVKLSRSLIPAGILIIPSLNEKGAKGTFELEVYSSEPVTLQQLPDAFNKSIASEWSEHTAMGGHMNPHWKKNPKFTLTFRHVLKAPDGSTPKIPVRITVSRYGVLWKSMCKKDTVGSMIGFYIFISRDNELTQIYESPFVPTEELSTDADFSLTNLQSGEEYVIMPTTFGEGKKGSFVISIMTETEFRFHKEKDKHEK